MKSFSSFHPFSLFCFYLSVIGIAMFSSNPYILGLALIGAMLSTIFSKSRKSLKAFFGYLFFFLAVSLVNPLVSHEGQTPLFFVNGNAFTLEAVIYGVKNGLMLVAVLVWFRTLNEHLDTDKQLYLFGKALPKTSLILSSVLRFVPLIKRQAVKVSETQKAMGLYADEGLKSALRSTSVSVSWALESSIETADTMRSRGYGLRGRTRYSDYRFRLRDGILCAVSLSVAATVILAHVFGALTTSFYPAFVLPKPSTMALITYALYGTLASVPFINEAKEQLKWHYLKSKI